MSDDGGFSGMSLFDLFRMEAESHCQALSEGTLRLEKNPHDAPTIAGLMRAAHSIKGAARIVGLDIIVTLAHAMEDAFVAAQEGRESLTSARIDQLLSAVDLLGEVRALSETQFEAWIRERTETVAAAAVALKTPPPAYSAPPAPPRNESSGAGLSTPVLPTPQPDPEPASEPTPGVARGSDVTQPPARAIGSTHDKAPKEPSGSAEGERDPLDAAPPSVSAEASDATHVAKTGAMGPGTVVRVSSHSLNRLMALASEATVEASRLNSLRNALEQLRGSERELEGKVGAVREAIRAVLKTGPSTQLRRVDPYVILEELASIVEDLHCARAEQTQRFDEAFGRLEEISAAIYRAALQSRMRPFSEGVTGFPRMVRDVAKHLGKHVEFRLIGEQVQVDRDILQKLEAPLTHLIRNSLDHGIELPHERAGKPATAHVTVSARHQSGMLAIEVRDDGRGFDLEAIRRKAVERGLISADAASKLARAELLEFPFLPGFTTRSATTELSGRGVGLDIVRSMTQEVGGVVTLESELGRGSKFTLRLPVTRSVIRAATVRVSGRTLAVPLGKLERVAAFDPNAVEAVQGRLQFSLDGRSVGLVRAAELLGFETGADEREGRAVLVLGGGTDDLCGLIVDELCGEEDLAVRPLDPRLGAVEMVAAAAIRANGEPSLVLDVDDLHRRLRRASEQGRPVGAVERASGEGRRALRVLVVDDSITVREVERQLLARRGYAVETATDGREGYNAVRAGNYDLVVTDVDMPRMTGLELVRALRREQRFENLPIIIVSYKDREEDRRAGMDAGASAYLTKSSFQDESLIRLVENLIGAPAA